MSCNPYFNPFFAQALNPAYVDVLDCPYLNYAKAPKYVKDEIPKPMSLPEQNVKGFINSLKYDYDALPNSVKEEYQKELKKFLNSDKIEDDTGVEKLSEESSVLLIQIIFIVISLVIVPLFAVWFFRNGQIK